MNRKYLIAIATTIVVVIALGLWTNAHPHSVMVDFLSIGTIFLALPLLVYLSASNSFLGRIWPKFFHPTSIFSKIFIGFYIVLFSFLQMCFFCTSTSHLWSFNSLGYAITKGLGRIVHTPTNLDFLALGALLVFFLLTLIYTGSLIESALISSITLLFLPVEIFLFDYGELNMHVTDAQVQYNIAPWISNLYLLYADLIFLLLMLAIYAWSKSRRKFLIAAPWPQRIGGFR